MKLNSLTYIILVVILVIILLIFNRYNKLIKKQNNVKKAKADIEIYLSKRFDLIPNIVECVKGYSKYENETLKDIISLRNNYLKKDNITIRDASNLNNRFNYFMGIVEAYPELKSDKNFMNLQSQLSIIEDELKNARISYNKMVTKYNILLETVPSNIVAIIFNFKKAELFKLEEEKKENNKVDL